MNIHVARLEDVCEVNPRMPKTIPDDEAVSFLPMAAISEEGRIDFEEQREVREVKKGYTYFERGDILVAKITPCFENGKAARTLSLVNSIGFGSTEFHVLRAGDKVDTSYLFHMIWNSKLREVGAKNMTGSAGQKRVPADFLKRVTIPLPPLGEQRRIAAILDKADALRRKCKRALDLLGGLVQSSFLELFGDPVSNPMNWPLTSIGGITSKIGSGATPAGGDAAYKESGISLVRSMNVRDEGFTRKGLAFIDEMQAAKLGNVALEEEDVLLNITGASVARVCLCPPEILPGRVNQHVSIIRPKDKAFSTYVAEALKTPTMKVKLLGISEAGATRQAITKSQIEQILLPIPKKEILGHFRAATGSHQALNRKMRRRAHSMDALFSSLQSRAFSGQL